MRGRSNIFGRFFQCQKTVILFHFTSLYLHHFILHFNFVLVDGFTVYNVVCFCHLTESFIASAEIFTALESHDR